MPEQPGVTPPAPAAPPEPAAPAPQSAYDKAIDTNDFATYRDIENARALGQKHPKDVEGKPSAPKAKEPAAPPPAPETAPQPPQAAPPGAPQRPPQRPLSRGERRFRELTARNRELEAQLANRTPGVTPPAPAARPATPAPPANDPKPVPASKPDGTAWKDWAEYQEAKDGWLIREGARQGDRAATQRASAARYMEQRTAVMAKPEYADYAEAEQSWLQNVKPNDALRLLIQQSDVGPQVIYAFGKNPRSAQVFMDALARDPIAAMRWWYTQFEAPLRTPPAPATPPATPPAAAPPEPAPKPQTPPRKPPPPPATDLGARNATPADEAEAAVKNNDFATFKRVTNSTELARLRRAAE